MGSQISRLISKPTKWSVHPAKTQISMGIAQRRLRSAWASAQSDQSSLPTWRNIGSSATHWATAKTLIRLCWSESLLGAQIILLVLSWGGSNAYNQPCWLPIIQTLITSTVQNFSECLTSLLPDLAHICWISVARQDDLYLVLSNCMLD